jgi:hypothetical protein
MNLDKVYESVSISEKKASVIFEKEAIPAIKLSNKILIKTYPSVTRTNSSNYEPTSFWNLGFQIGLFNYKT